MKSDFKYPLFSKNDMSAFWALFTDNLTNLIVLSGICKFVFQMPDQIVFGRIIPGAAVAILMGVCVYTYLARRLAEKTGRTDVTALPYGISTPVMFVYLFGVIGPIYWATNDALLAWQIGIGAGFLGGIVAGLGALIGPFLKRVTPRAGMLGTLCGIALVFIGTVPLTMVFEEPMIGFISLAVVMWGLVGCFRLPFNMPAGLVALILGTTVALFLGKSSINFEGVGFYPPLPYLGDMIIGIKHLFSHPELFLVLVPVQIYNFIETMNNVESAEAVGDSYPVSVAMVTDGFGTMLGALFGSPFPTTVYLGHPGYKRIKARCGYVLAVGIVLFLAASFGLMAFLNNLVPLAATAPILVYVAVIIISESARTCPTRHGMAIAIAMMPHISSFVVMKWGSMLNALGNLGIQQIPGLSDPKTVEAMASEGAHVIGHQILSQGAIITGLMWGAFLALLIDGKFKAASGFILVAAAMASLGIIHSPNLHWPEFNSIVGGYLFVGLSILFYSMFAKIECLADNSTFDRTEDTALEYAE
ncbi:MAG: xanthine/uracil/vitamin C permease [Desulfobacteraceae bacterium]|nr:xanthine/uracil/vitamin C permease [Desulfobacteraceae bacterium]